MLATVKRVRELAGDTQGMSDAEIRARVDDANTATGIEDPTRWAVGLCRAWMAGRRRAETREARILKMITEEI